MKAKGDDPARLFTLIGLMRLGGGASSARISSESLGEALAISQQAASRRLTDLERAGLIERSRSGRGASVRLTDKGLLAVSGLYLEIKSLLGDGPRTVEFTGEVFTGLGEGSYYVSLEGYAKSFLRLLGFKPYPGTLNLKLADGPSVERRRELKLLEGIDIPGFTGQGRTYGPVKCFRAVIAGSRPGAVLAIERTHYDNTVLEVVSPLNLREELHLKDGDPCSVSVMLEKGSGKSA